MPQGVSVLVHGDGFVTVEFDDPNAKGPWLAKLLAVMSADDIAKSTYPRHSYTMPEAAAAAAGLLDFPANPAPSPKPEPKPAPAEKSHGYDDGEPDMDWSRAALNAAAAKAKVPHPEKLPNKEAVLQAYRDAKAKAAEAPKTD